MMISLTPSLGQIPRSTNLPQENAFPVLNLQDLAVEYSYHGRVSSAHHWCRVYKIDVGTWLARVELIHKGAARLNILKASIPFVSTMKSSLAHVAS